mmetsp:Transcript_1513/g.1930  ORF Transcript_1513/g.1930 Transcript_1513/m.1930 type:complete len:250 (+) Transcript_1513:191-940(+)
MDGSANDTHIREITRRQGSSVNNNNKFQYLPKEIIGEIFSFVTVRDVLKFRGTSKDARHHNSKVLYTQRHCETMALNLELIYKRGGLSAVRRILSDDARVDPSVNNNRAVRWASENGHIDFVRELMKDPRVDPSADNNDAIFLANFYSHVDVVKELMTDSRVDPSVKGNYPIRLAIRKGNVNAVRELLKDSRVDSTLAITKAAEYGRVDVLRVLLMESRVDASSRYADDIQMARNGDLERIVERLTMLN